MNDIFDRLTDEQKKAVYVEKGPIRVIASAGSGKTSALTARYVWLRKTMSVPAHRIACVTFTNKAATEMKSRIQKELGTKEGLEFVCTFHSLGYKIMKKEAHRIGWPGRSLPILDDKDVEEILTNIYDEAGITNQQITHTEALDYIKGRKRTETSYGSLLFWNSEKNLEQLISRANSPKEKIYLMYLQKQRRDFCLDFDDLILMPLFLFERFPDVNEFWSKQFHYVMVDEFQDVSDPNYALCSAIAPENLYVVGDPDQLIYTWRKADMSYILQFDQTHPGTKTFTINTNHRSTPAIIAAANKLISHNKSRYPKDMVPCTAKAKNTTKVRFYHARTKADEANFVAKEIKRLHESGCLYRDIKILYRKHDCARLFEESLITAGIPYVTRGQTPFYRTQEIKAILSYLRLIERDNDFDFEHAIAQPKRNIGKKALSKIKSNINENCPTMLSALRAMIKNGGNKSEKAAEFVNIIDTFTAEKEKLSLQNLVESVIERSGLQEYYQTIGNERRLNNIADLKNAIRQMENNSSERITLADYLDEIAAFTVAEKNTEDAVEMMTVHTAKGTEAPVVFVVAMNDGVFPSAKATSPKEFEEERRLAYVAFTRAMDILYISEAERFSAKEEEDPKSPPMLPSPFIIEAGYGDMQLLNGGLPERIIHLMESRNHSSNSGEDVKYKEGDSVTHSTFGIGVVEEVLDDGTLTVHFYDPEEIRNIVVDQNLSHASP